MIRLTYKYTVFCMLLASVFFFSSGFADTAKVGWTAFEEGMSRAKTENKPVYVDFYATWCPPCKMMEKSTFTDASVISALNNQFVAIKVDVDKNKELAAKYGARAIPHHVVMSSDGKVLNQFKGAIPAEMFLKILNQSVPK